MDATPLLSLAIHPKTQGDREKLEDGLRRMMAEDPALAVAADPAGDVTIGTSGELQLEIVIDRLKREFEVEATVGRVQVVYREALTRAADGDGRYAGQAAGRGEYARVRIHAYPGQPGTGFVFENMLFGGAIPDRFITPIREGIEDACTRGVLAGYPIRDVRIELYDGSHHDVDSSELAFRRAGAMAFEDAARNAGPVLLEPVMRVEVVTPHEHIAAVIGDLFGRHGQMHSRKTIGDREIVLAFVPLAELFGYATTLRASTRGRATYSHQLDRYQEVRADPPIEDDDGTSPVRAPLTPSPSPNESAVALPEPDDDRPEP
jgi:elongation factor G